MTNDHYILKGKELVKVKMLVWAKWFETNDRSIRKDDLADSKRVSTVFLGIDHNFSDKGYPLLFETMVFPKDSWGELDMDRYSTYVEAEKGHKKMVKKWNKKIK